MMAGAAVKARRTGTVDAAHDPGPVRLQAVGLCGPVSHWMTVQAAGTLDDLAGFAEQRDRSGVSVRTLGLTERGLREGAYAREKRRGRHHQDGWTHHQSSSARAAW